MTDMANVPEEPEIESAAKAEQILKDLAKKLAPEGQLAEAIPSIAEIVPAFPDPQGTLSGCNRSYQSEGLLSHSSGVYPRMDSICGLT